MIVSVVASVHYKWWLVKVLKQVHFYQSLVLLWGAELTVVTFSSYFLFFLLFFAVFIPVLGLLLDGTIDPAALIEAFVEEMSYPIFMTFLREPVSINCGHTFCYSCLSGLWKLSRASQDLDHTCPLCQAPMQPRKLCPNWQLASVVDEVHLLGFCMEMGLKTDVCDLHKEPLMCSAKRLTR